MSFVKLILIILGTLSLCVGVIGIMIPGLPTTPFVLLTAGLYIKSSDKLYQKLLSTRLIGSYLTEFQTNKGMTKKSKLLAIASMWIMILISILFFIDTISLRLIIAVIGLIGTFVMGLMVPTVKS
ncbi:MAG: YbaN family protein [Bacteroidales bacterium]|nr:YbaN family protein [Bacteroidales bacterium]